MFRQDPAPNGLAVRRPETASGRAPFSAAHEAKERTSIMPRWDPDDARLVSTALTDALMCVECIIKETGVTRARIKALLASLIDTRNVTSRLAACASCLSAKTVFQLTEPT